MSAPAPPRGSMPAVLRLLLAILLCVAPGRAWAAYAEILEVTTADAAGRWRPVDSTVRAVVLRGDQRLPASRGLALEEGDRVVTEEARLRIALQRGEELAVAEHTDVEVRGRTALQRLGEVYYRVRGAFSVRYGTVQTAVEGTEFAVRGLGDADDAAVRVTVVEGRVRVSGPGGEARVRRWQVADVAGGAPVVAARPFLAARAVDRGFPRATRLGVVLGGGLDAGAVGQARVFARVPVTGPLRLAVDTGVATGGSTVRLPQALGVEVAAGPLTLGAQVVGTVELARLGCDGAYTALHLGGVGAVGTSLPLSRRVSLLGVARAGWVQGPLADGAVGLVVSL